MKATISGANAVDEVFNWFDEQTDETPTILIAEDDAISRRVLEATLCSYGYRVVAVSNGLEACRVLEGAEPPHLAILDLCMPERDGLEVCKWVRSSAKLKYTYVILLTTKSSTSDVVTGLYLGADDYIAKPYDRAELRARIQVGLRVLALQKELAAKLCPNCRVAYTD
jgi:DNA-binding response OmpR family regulator